MRTIATLGSLPLGRLQHYLDCPQRLLGTANHAEGDNPHEMRAGRAIRQVTGEFPQRRLSHPQCLVMIPALGALEQPRDSGRLEDLKLGLRCSLPVPFEPVEAASSGRATVDGSMATRTNGQTNGFQREPVLDVRVQLRVLDKFGRLGTPSLPFGLPLRNRGPVLQLPAARRRCGAARVRSPMPAGPVSDRSHALRHLGS